MMKNYLYIEGTTCALLQKTGSAFCKKTQYDHLHQKCYFAESWEFQIIFLLFPAEKRLHHQHFSLWIIFSTCHAFNKEKQVPYFHGKGVEILATFPQKKFSTFVQLIFPQEKHKTELTFLRFHGEAFSMGSENSFYRKIGKSPWN